MEPGSDGESKAPRGEMPQRSQNQGPGPMPGSRLRCFKCGGTGHFARSCTHVPPQSEAPGRYTSRRYAASKTETSGRGPPARTAALTANPSSTKFSVAELEEMLAKRRLEQESELLQQTSTASGSQVDMVTAENLPTSAVGPTLLLELQIEGVKVNALVDSGSQSTIISRRVLQDIGKHFHSQGRPPPQLEKPSARLYGKDGQRGNRPLNITAQVTLNLSADGTSVSVPVFVQPDSEQPCLLGTNAALSLGLKFLRADGRPLLVQSARLSTPPDTAVVRLVQSSTLPGRKGRFLEALIDGPIRKGDELLFEPNTRALKELGLSSLLKVGVSGQVLVPLQNFRRDDVKLDGGTELGCVEPFGCDVELPSPGVGLCDCVEESNGAVELSDSGVGPVNGIEVEQGARGEGVEGALPSQVLAVSDSSRGPRLLDQLALPRESLSQGQLQQLEELLIKAEDVFALDDSELGCTSLVQHRVDTGEHPAVKQLPRRMPFSQREKVAELVDDMLKGGIIQPSASAWASPIVLVPKRDGSLRFCVDYRKVNSITKKDVYPLPRIDDILDTLSEARYFSTLDLASGFWQIEMDPATREKTAFITHCG